jgi:hypothetical protein
MTNTAVVLGIATLGTPEAASDGDSAIDDFIGLSSQSSLIRSMSKEYDSTLFE